MIQNEMNYFFIQICQKVTKYWWSGSYA